MKMLLKFKIFAHCGPLKNWNMAKSRNWSRDENFAQISDFCPPRSFKNLKYGKI